MIDEKEVLKILKRYEGRMNPTAYFSLEADIVNIEALEQEPTTENCESCRYYGSHHEVCNYCYECSLWTEQEPATKNDLGVDREDAVERLKALKQLIGYDKDSEIVKATQKSLDMAIKALEQEPRKGHWVKTPKAVMGEGYMWYCDKCEHQVYQDSSRDYPSEKYCPNCGAKMVEPQESEDA